MIVLGIRSFLLTGAASATALIPAFFDIVFIGLGVHGINNEAMRKHAMHAAPLLAILGIGGSFGGLVNVLGVLGGNELARPNTSYAQAAMSLICIYFIIAGSDHLSTLEKRLIQKLAPKTRRCAPPIRI